MRHGAVPHHEFVNSHQKALIAARAALEKQAEDVLLMDIGALSNVTDFLVIGTADSFRQLTALKEHLETVLAQHGQAVWHSEGSPASPAKVPEPQWLLMDCGDVVIHLLDRSARAFYRLEDLWADAPRVAVEDASAPAPSPS